METLVRLPTNTFNPQAFDCLAAGVHLADGGRIRFDLSGCAFFEPFGVVGLLFLLRYAAAHHTVVTCDLPAAEAARQYLTAIDFYRQAIQYAEFNPALPRSNPVRIMTDSDFSLALTPIRSEEDVELIVKDLVFRIRTILSCSLLYNPAVLNKVCVALAEICQNIPQHSGDWGVVTLQSYRSRQKSGDRFIKLAVGDLGIGIMNSLASRLGTSDIGDGEAIMAALRFGVSRFGEPGRGLGLAAVAALAKALGGSLQVRSGRARVLLRSSHNYIFTVPFFPGTQISLELPARHLFINSYSDIPDNNGIKNEYVCIPAPV